MARNHIRDEINREAWPDHFGPTCAPRFAPPASEAGRLSTEIARLERERDAATDESFRLWTRLGKAEDEARAWRRIACVLGAAITALTAWVLMARG